MNSYVAQVRYWKRNPYRRGPSKSRIEQLAVAAIDMLNALLLLRGTCQERWRHWELIEIKEVYKYEPKVVKP